MPNGNTAVFFGDLCRSTPEVPRAARAAGAAIESHVNPNAEGLNGEELATDVARFGDMDAENLFITCSGTHGNEGFCGSGCQIGFIKEGIINARPKSVAVLLVHAINPYGFSHVRRVTEDNSISTAISRISPNRCPRTRATPESMICWSHPTGMAQGAPRQTQRSRTGSP